MSEPTITSGTGRLHQVTVRQDGEVVSVGFPIYTNGDCQTVSMTTAGKLRPVRHWRLTHVLNQGTGLYDRRWWWKAFGNAMIGRPALWLSWRLHYWRYREHYGDRWLRG